MWHGVHLLMLVRWCVLHVVLVLIVWVTLSRLLRARPAQRAWCSSAGCSITRSFAVFVASTPPAVA
jgi:hypothetical protein